MMLRTSRRDRYSSLVLIAILFAIVAVTWITNSPPENSIEYPTATNAQNGQQDNVTQPVSAVYNPWRDSYAQWLVAITSLAAVIVSIGAVFLVRDTLRENRKATKAAESAVAEARRASDAQLRPFIVYDSVKISVLTVENDSSKLMQLDISFRNCGLSPGVLTAVSSNIYAPDGSGTWPRRTGSWRPIRAVVGPNQNEKIRFSGVTIEKDGSFTWFTIGILIHYETLGGMSFEDVVWLTYDGTGMRQDYHISSHYELYRPKDE